MSPENIDLRAHHIGWVEKGVGYDEHQREIVRGLRKYALSRIVPINKPDVICRNCPYYFEAPNFSDEQICDPYSPDLTELDEELIRQKDG